MHRTLGAFRRSLARSTPPLVSARHRTAMADSKLIFAPGGAEASSTDDAQEPAGRAAQFLKSTLTRSELSASPTAQFHAWFSEASAAQVPHPETCCLATAGLPSGAPSARFVYLKELDARGFVFYSNFGHSRKGADLATNPQASLAFWWQPLERQVRVEGRFERLSPAESSHYFRLRERGSKVGAWASRQSQVLGPGGGDGDGREVLDGWVDEVESRLSRDGTAEDDIEVPPHWGGGRVVPLAVEFWQGRQSRLHDRFRYTRASEHSEEWVVERLSP